MNKHIYANAPVLDRSWTTKELLAWTDEQITVYAAEIYKVAAENDAKRKTLRDQQAQARDEFRAQHPRSDFPAHLIRAVRPVPDLRGQWARLLKRREDAIRSIEKQNAQRKAAFLDKMSAGRGRAMERREQTVRSLIQQVAKKHQIELTARATDKMLEELFRKMGEELE